jgi:hypothetical protein
MTPSRRSKGFGWRGPSSTDNNRSGSPSNSVIAGFERIAPISRMTETNSTGTKNIPSRVAGATALKTGVGAEWPGGEDPASYMRQCIRYFVNGIRLR